MPTVHYQLIEELGLPVYPTPERAVKAIGALVRYGKALFSANSLNQRN